jgi:hypothetical protein
MQLWLDPLVRKTCGDAINAAPGLALTLLKRGHVHDPLRAGARVAGGLQPTAAPGEIAPGLAFDGVVLAASREIQDGGVASRNAADLLRVVAGHLRAAADPFDVDSAVVRAMRGMGMQRRAALALAIASERDDDVECWGGMMGGGGGGGGATGGAGDSPGKAVLECWRLALQAACACGGAEECVRVMRAAAAGAWRDDTPEGGDVGTGPGTSTTAPDGGVAAAAEVALCAPGQMRDGRAAFHWCLRQCHAELGARAPQASLELMRDVASAVRGWHLAKWPMEAAKPGGTAAARAAAGEKMACLNLVQTPEAAERYRKMFGADASW